MDPHAVLVLTPAWYLVGFDPQRNAFRHFRMDRMSSASVLDQPFRRRPFKVEEGECPFSNFILDEQLDLAH